MKPSKLLTMCTVLALAACNGETKKETGGTAGGEILPASVGDEMLPYDKVRSQAPLAPTAEGGEAAKDKKGEEPKARQKAEAAGEPAPAEPAEPAE